MRSGSALLTTEEVADRLRVSRATVSRWARTGVLNPVRLTGRTVRFRAEDVEAMLSGSPA